MGVFGYLAPSAVVAAFLGTTSAAHSPGSFNASCSALASSISIQDVTVTFAKYVAAGTNLTFPNVSSTCNTPYQVVPVDLCWVSMSVTTSNMSGIILEAWLPQNWTGRFLSTGNGGLGGCIQYQDMAYASGQGFATVGANNGHNGMSGEPFYHNDEIVADFAYRSLHTGVVIGKEISNSFYKKPYSKSYYLGCSTGGREGFKSVQDFPNDFDGVLAGSPAIAFNSLNAWSNHFYGITGNSTSPNFISNALWSTIHTEVLNQCDGLDGLVDGIIEDPDLCNFNATKMLCATASSTNCLTPAQAVTVSKVFSALYLANGTLVYPRMQPGSELIAAEVYYTGGPSPFTDWFTYAILEDPTWNSFTQDSAEIAFALQKNPFDIETWKGDLSSFRDSGGKVLHYHGMQDPIISSDNSERYYKHVSKTMESSPAELDSFYRYFRISGMGHCSGGPGAWQIGQTAAGTSNLDPQDNVLLRLVDWVENGAAPETLRGTKYVNDTAALGTAFVRDHCRYPRRNKYNGHGDPNATSSWTCVYP